MTAATLDRPTFLGHVARRFADFGAPLDACLAALQDLPEASNVHRRRDDMTALLCGAPEIVLSGWACTMRLEARRTRMIFGFVLPGDVLGSFWRAPEFTFWRLTALTPVLTVSALALLATDGDGSLRSPEVLRAARRAEDHAHHLLLDHVVRLGARDAYGGLAHLFLELYARLERVGLAQGGDFHLPIGQRVLAQAMGFSVAHTNHTLQRMAADGLVRVEDEIVRLLQPERLAALADFTRHEPVDAVGTGSAMEGLHHEPQVHRHDQCA